jgi:hypothetical protein
MKRVYYLFDVPSSARRGGLFAKTVRVFSSTFSFDVVVKRRKSQSHLK